MSSCFCPRLICLLPPSPSALRDGQHNGQAPVLQTDVSKEHQWTGAGRDGGAFSPANILLRTTQDCLSQGKTEDGAVKPSKHLRDPPGRQPGVAADGESRPLANSSSQRQMRSAMEMRQEGAERRDRWGWVGCINE